MTLGRFTGTWPYNLLEPRRNRHHKNRSRFDLIWSRSWALRPRDPITCSDFSASQKSWKRRVPWRNTRPGKRLHHYGKIHHFSWANPLFLWSFSIAILTQPEGSGWDGLDPNFGLSQRKKSICSFIGFWIDWYSHTISYIMYVYIYIY